MYVCMYVCMYPSICNSSKGGPKQEGHVRRRVLDQYQRVQIVRFVYKYVLFANTFYLFTKTYYLYTNTSYLYTNSRLRTLRQRQSDAGTHPSDDAVD